MVVLAAVGFIFSGIATNLGRSAHWIPAAIVGGLAFAQLLIFERCPHCGKSAMISRNSVKHCPGCGKDIDQSSELEGLGCHEDAKE